MSNLANIDFNDDESDEEDFNPAPEQGSDDEGENGIDSDVQESSPPSKRKESANRKVKSVENDEDDEDEAADDNDRVKKRADVNAEEEEDDDAEGEDEGDVDDDEEDEDEDEEDEEQVADRPRKRRRREGRNQFIDAEAEVDDEEDEEDEGDDDDLAAEEAHPDDLAELPVGGEHDDRRHRELDRMREEQQNLDAEKQAEVLKERYGKRQRVAQENVLAPQQLLMPDESDPKIWQVRCKPGKEREIIFAIMKRLRASMKTKSPLGVTAAFEREGPMSGNIYVESRDPKQIMPACVGINYLYPHSKIQLIDIKEMPDLLRTKKDKKIQMGQYVRIKRGLYAGDLAEVVEATSNGAEVEVRLVPRIDYGHAEDLNAAAGSDGQKRKRPGFSNLTRPPPRLFNEQEAKKNHPKYFVPLTDYNNKRFQFKNKEYVNGYLHETFKINAVETEGVNLTLEEVSKFANKGEDGSANLDLEKLAKALKQTTTGADFLPGDNVELFQGEQKGVSGKAVAVRADVVSMKVSAGPLAGKIIDAPVASIRKMFKVGDHVKVTGASRYLDEVGMITKVTQDRVTFLSDANLEEIEVFSKDLREAADQSSTRRAGSKYDLYDLVQLDAARVSVVIKVDRESLRILDQDNSVRSLLPSSISQKLEKRRHAVATDRDGSEVRPDDTVKEFGGEGRQGRVLHIHRSFVFVHDRGRPENAGVFCSRSTNVLIVAAKGGAVSSAGPDLSKMNPALQRQSGPNTQSAMGPPKTVGRDKMIGKTVMVRKGPSKGLLGIVKEATDTQARVELHSRNRMITISKDLLTVKDPITGQTVDFNKFSGTRRPGGTGQPQSPFGAGAPPSRVPSGFSGSRTPSRPEGSATPAWGLQQSRRPAWESGDGGKTPGWSRNDGGRTPGWAAQDGNRTVSHRPSDGSRTSYGGASGGGTSWGSGAKTPAPGSHGERDGGLGTGSRTPHHLSSARTPNPYASAPTPGVANVPTPGVWNSHRDAGVTPGAFDAPTPGVYGAPTPAAGAALDHPTPGGPGRYGERFGLSAPTPGAMDAPTPGVPGRYAAPTPGVGYAETPGVWAAGTPAALDEDPRYE